MRVPPTARTAASYGTSSVLPASVRIVIVFFAVSIAVATAGARSVTPWALNVSGE